MTELTRLRAQIEAFAPYNEQEEADRRQMLADMDCFSDLLTRENATAHFTASCWIVNPDRTKVLMAYHNLYQSWAWLGGHADGEADLLSVALREANEESGVLAAPVSPDIFSLEILHVAPHVKRGKFVCAHLHLNATYLLEADDKSPIRCKPDENSAVRWLSVQDVLSSVSEPAMRPVYQKLMEKGVIEVAPLAYMRGRTLNNAFIILDEAQNTTREQMKMFLTRLGENSIMVVTGDLTQIDLPEGKKSGLKNAVTVLKDVKDIAIRFLSEKDVVRHPLVQEIVKAYERAEKRQGV